MAEKREPDAALAARMLEGRHRLERRVGRSVTITEIGELVAQQVGRAEPFAPPVVRRWLLGQQDPGSRELWQALANVFGVPVGWLAFGEEAIAQHYDPDDLIPGPTEAEVNGHVTPARKRRGGR